MGFLINLNFILPQCYFTSPIFSARNVLKVFILLCFIYFWFLVSVFVLQILIPVIFTKFFGWKKRSCMKSCVPANCYSKAKKMSLDNIESVPEDDKKSLETNYPNCVQCPSEPEVSTQTNELKEECKDFVQNITQFQTIVDGFISMINSLAQDVETEKMKAIGLHNLTKSMVKQREAQRQQLQALLLEKSTELERLRVQHQSLVRTEMEQQEVIDQLALYR